MYYAAQFVIKPARWYGKWLCRLFGHKITGFAGHQWCNQCDTELHRAE